MGRQLDCFSEIDHRHRRRPVHNVTAGNPIDRLLDHGGGFDSERPCLCGPTVVEGLCVGGVRFGWAAVGGGFAFQPPTLPWCWLTAHRLDEPVELVVNPTRHRCCAGRELGQHRIGDIGDLSDPVLGLMPANTEPCRQLGPQRNVVQRGQGLLVAFDQTGVERQPATVRGLDPIRDHQMRMQLRVQRPTGVLPERGGHDPLNVDDRDLTTDPVAGVGVGLDPPGQFPHRGVVRVEDGAPDVLIAQRPQHRDGLGCRCGHVEPAYRLVVVAPSQIAIRPARVHAGHHRQERLVADFAADAELLSAGSEPDATRFAGVEVVVRQLLDVVRASVGALQRGHAYGHHTPPHTRVAVHSSVIAMS